MSNLKVLGFALSITIKVQYCFPLCARWQDDFGNSFKQHVTLNAFSTKLVVNNEYTKCMYNK